MFRKYRWLFLILIVAAVGISVAVEGFFAAQRAVNARLVATYGGIVVFDDGKNGDTRSITPAWLRKAFGEKYYQQIKAVDFATNWGGRAQDGDSNITDNDLALLSRFHEVGALDLGNHPAITDAGLIYLHDLKMTTLRLHRTGIEGPGLRHLASIQNLRVVSLAITPLRDEGLAHLKQVPQLDWLDLRNTRITDDGLRYVAEMKCLEELQLNQTNVTDVGLIHLHSAKQLRKLRLNGTNVTGQGVAELQLALPHCEISPTPEYLNAVPENVPLWEPSYTPTREELVARVEELGGRVTVDENGDVSGNHFLSVASRIDSSQNRHQPK